MKKEVAKKWIKALRSGKYKQGQGVLKQTTDNGQTYHCCLGVLCELYNQDMKDKKKKTLNETRYNGIHRLNKQNETLPLVVRNWSGLYGKYGDFKDGRDQIYFSLADMNDLGKKFTTIANTIEKQWENL